MDCQSEAVKNIVKLSKEQGDLPLFSATVNRIRKVSADPDSNTAGLSNEVTKDANLTVTLLRLANSPYYNRGAGKISSISRGIVILGFNTIMNLSLTVKLIDTFSNDHPEIELNKMLVNAYQAASFARELALKCGIKDVEETYICVLMHNVGEILVAYFLPDQYLKLQKNNSDLKLTPQQIEQQVLGITLQEIGQCLASSWEFPSSIITCMKPYNFKSDKAARGHVQINHAISALSENLIGKLHGKSHMADLPVEELMGKIADVVGLEHSVIETCLIDSFKMSCELASDYGLNKNMLMPSLDQSGDVLRDRLAGKLSYVTNNYRGANNDQEEGGENNIELANEELSSITKVGDSSASTSQDEKNVDDAGTIEKNDAPDIHQQLKYIQDITALISESGNLNSVFTCVVEAMCNAASFDRAVLCLLNAKHSRYTARILYGDDGSLEKYFDFDLDAKKDLFSRVLLGENELVIDNLKFSKWQNIVRDDFFENTQANSFMAAPLWRNNKPVGLFYADRIGDGVIISNEQQRAFMQFVVQARLALKLR